MGKRSLYVRPLALVAVDKSGTGYTEAFPFERCTGEIATHIVSSAGSITITQQTALREGGPFLDPVNAAGSAVGAVVAALTGTAGKYVTFTPCLAPAARFKIVEGGTAGANVTITVIAQEEF